jgi:hypothetical protein
MEDVLAGLIRGLPNSIPFIRKGFSLTLVVSILPAAKLLRGTTVTAFRTWMFRYALFMSFGLAPAREMSTLWRPKCPWP